MKNAISKNWRYLKYITKHKYFVWVAGRRVGTSLWRILVHDLSKFNPVEWLPYREYFYGSPCEGFQGRKDGVLCADCRKRKENFEYAWLHHVHKNPHHWNHFVYRGESKVKLLEMPEKYVREMVADWAGAGKAITGKWEIKEWYEKNKEKIYLAPKTRSFVEYLINNTWS